MRTPLIAALALLIAAWASTALAAPAAPAPAPPEYALSDGALVWSTPGAEPVRVELPCAGEALLLHGGKVHVVCPAEGVAIFERADGAPPALVGVRRFPGSVHGLHVAGGRVWVELTRLEARPLDGPSAPAPASQPVVAARTPEAPAPVEMAEARVGRVIEVQSGLVIVDLGASDGLAKGDGVELFIVHEVSLGDGDRRALEEERIAIGTVTVVDEGRARVMLGRNERVPADAFARGTDERRTGNPVVPPRVEDVLMVGFTVRPFLALNVLGFGGINDFNLTWRDSGGFAVHAALQPLGFAIADDGNVLATDAFVAMTFDTRVFEIGFGAGWASVADSDTSAGNALSLQQLARLGSLDGVNLAVQNSFVLYDREFHYGGSRAALTMSIGDRFALFGRGGGGVSGYAFGEIGLRVLARGRGDRGSLSIDATLGGAGVSGKEKCRQQRFDDNTFLSCESTGYGGPMVGFGMQWRL